LLAVRGICHLPRRCPRRRTPARARAGQVRGQAEELWRKGIKTHWNALRQSGRAVAPVDNARTGGANAGIDVDALWDKAALLLDLKGEETANLLRQIWCAPGSLAANFHLGRILLERGCHEGERISNGHGGG